MGAKERAGCQRRDRRGEGKGPAGLHKSRDVPQRARGGEMSGCDHATGGVPTAALGLPGCSPAGAGAAAPGEDVAGASTARFTLPSSRASRVIVRKAWKKSNMSLTPPMPNQINVVKAIAKGMAMPITSQ